MTGERVATIGSYDSSIYERRTEVTDSAQKEHLARCRPWLKVGDCTCRRSDGRYWNICVNANCSNEGLACGGFCRRCFKRHGENVQFLMDVPELDFHYLAHQREWSDETFGPGARTLGVVDHIRKELVEVVEADGALDEWADVILLAIDGATRSASAQGRSVADVLKAVAAKQERNEGRTWPDWRTCDPDKAIEHDRSADGDSGSRAAR